MKKMFGPELFVITEFDCTSKFKFATKLKNFKWQGSKFFLFIDFWRCGKSYHYRRGSKIILKFVTSNLVNIIFELSNF